MERWQPAERTIAYGTLEENSDTWFLMTPDRMILLDVPFVGDNSLEHKTVGVIGKMGIPPSAPGITKLIAERIIPHEAIETGHSTSSNQQREDLKTITGSGPNASY